MFESLAALPVAEMVALRTAVRQASFAARQPDHWDTQGCWQVSEAMAARFGWEVADGCYVEDAFHLSHVWNRLPDGRILDTTADQYGEPAPGIRLLAANDERYDEHCDGERCGGFENALERYGAEEDADEDVDDEDEA